METYGRIKRKGREETPQVLPLELEHIIGLSEPSATVACISPGKIEGVLAYAAGSFVVLYDWKKRKQLQTLRSKTSNQPITCICWSASGRYLACGEAGSPAPIYVWDTTEGTCIQELRGHKSTILALCFSPDDKMLASVSEAQLILWEPLVGVLACKHALPPAGKANAVAFTEDGSHVLVAGKDVFKAWQLPNTPTAKAKAGGGAFSIIPRTVLLKEHKDKPFVDVRMAASPRDMAVGTNGIYALTASGWLLMLRATGKTIDRAVNLQVKAANGLGVCNLWVAACCNAGIIRLFHCRSLIFKATLPRVVAKASEHALSESETGPSSTSIFPAAMGCSFSPNQEQLSVAYADRTIIVWGVKDPAKAAHLARLSAHCDCIWDIAPVPNRHRGGPARCITCGADGTLRIWSLDNNEAAAGGVSGRSLAGAITVTRSLQDSSSQPSSNAALPVSLRCLAVSPDGAHAACGDVSGNLRVFDLTTLQLVAYKEAHDGEVLTLDYSPMTPEGFCLLASGGRDSFIHLYDVQQGYELLETLGDHSASVTAVKFGADGTSLISCSADKSIKFRILGVGVSGATEAYQEEVVPNCLLYSLAMDPLGQTVTSVGQDGYLRRWEVGTGTLKTQMAAEAGAGEPVKVSIDPGGITAITCHSDGCVRLYHLATGQLLWRAWGHAELVTGACVAPDLRHVVSVGGDGCMVVWRLPYALAESMQQAATKIAAAAAAAVAAGRNTAMAGEATSAALSEASAVGGLAAPQSPGFADSKGCNSPPNPIGGAYAGQQRLQQQVFGCEAPQRSNVGHACQPAAAAPAGLYSTPGAQCRPENDMYVSPKLDPLTRIWQQEGTPDTSLTGGLALFAQRVRQGRPLLSVSRLPKWAQGSPGDYGSQERSCSMEESGSGVPALRQSSRWAKNLEEEFCVHNEKGEPLVLKRADDGTYRRTETMEDMPNSCNGAVARVGPSAAAALEDNILMYECDADPLVTFSVEGVVDGEGNTEELDVALTESVSQSKHEGPGEWETGHQDSRQQEQQIPEPSPVGELNIRQNLFLQHFNSLSQGEESPAATHFRGGGTADIDRRFSLSTRFKLERTSSSGNCHCGLSPGSQSLAAVAAANAAKARSSNHSGTSAAAKEQSNQQQNAVQPSGVSASGADVDAALHGTTEGGNAGAGTASQQGRWREGKMGTELKRMQDRLANLQSMYQQQLLGKQRSFSMQEPPAAASTTMGGMDRVSEGGLKLLPDGCDEARSGRPLQDSFGLSTVADECSSRSYIDSISQQRKEEERTPDSKGPRRAAAAPGGSSVPTGAGAGPQAADAPAAVAVPAATTPMQPAGTPPGVASKRAAVVARLSAVAGLSRASSLVCNSAATAREGDEAFGTPVAERVRGSADGDTGGSSTSGSSASAPLLATPLPLVLEQPVLAASSQVTLLSTSMASTAPSDEALEAETEAAGSPAAAAPGLQCEGHSPAPAAAATDLQHEGHSPAPAAAATSLQHEGHSPAPAAAAGLQCEGHSPAPAAAAGLQCEGHGSAPAAGEVMSEAGAVPADIEAEGHAAAAQPAAGNGAGGVCSNSNTMYTPARKDGVVEGEKSSGRAGPAVELHTATTGAAMEAPLTPMAAVVTPGTVDATPAAVPQGLEVGMVEYMNPCYDMTPGSALPVGAVPFSSLVAQVPLAQPKFNITDATTPLVGAESPGTASVLACAAAAATANGAWEQVGDRHQSGALTSNAAEVSARSTPSGVAGPAATDGSVLGLLQRMVSFPSLKKTWDHAAIAGASGGSPKGSISGQRSSRDGASAPALLAAAGAIGQQASCLSTCNRGGQQGGRLSGGGSVGIQGDGESKTATAEPHGVTANADKDETLQVAERAASALLEFQRVVAQLQTSWQEVCALNVNQQQQQRRGHQQREGQELQQEGGEGLHGVRAEFQRYVQAGVQQLHKGVLRDFASSSREDSIPAGYLSSAANGSPSTPHSKGSQVQQYLAGMNPHHTTSEVMPVCGVGGPDTNETRSARSSYSFASPAFSLASSFPGPPSSVGVNEMTAMILEQYTDMLMKKLDERKQ